MRMIAAVLLLSVLPSCGSHRVIPDQRIPHRVAQEGTVIVWTRKPDGTMHQVPVVVQPGWWIASPVVIGE